MEILLRGLRPERGEVWRQRDADDDLDVLLLELTDDRREVVGQHLEPSGIDDRVTSRRGTGRKACVGVGERVAVGIVRAQEADHLVRLRGIPDLDEDADELLGAPEEVIRPLEPDRRIPATREEVGLPRSECREARHTVGLALVGDRVDHLGCGDREHHVDAVVENQLARPSRGGVRVRLHVTLDDLDGVRLIPDHQAVGDELVDAGEDVFVRCAEARERTGERRGEPDLDRAVTATTAEYRGVGACPPGCRGGASPCRSGSARRARTAACRARCLAVVSTTRCEDRSHGRAAPDDQHAAAGVDRSRGPALVLVHPLSPLWSRVAALNHTFIILKRYRNRVYIAHKHSVEGGPQWRCRAWPR